MDWLLKNPQVVFLFIIGVIALVGRLARSLKEQQAAREQQMRTGKTQPEDARPPPLHPAAADPDEASRALRAQEEIRRKILARMSAGRRQPPALPQAVAFPTPPAASDTPIAATAAASVTESFPPARHAAETAAPTATTGELIAALHNQSAIRQAVILREILDKPAGLRGSQGEKPF